jgi:uncharacterized protein YfaS (alpha-2-macroglobulin family)
MVAELLKGGVRSTHDGLFGCPTREEAIRLLAWVHHAPTNAAVDTLVNELMSEQKAAHWETTQGNAWALLALTDYARLVETKLQSAAGNVAYAGQSCEFQLDECTNVFTCTFAISSNAILNLTNASTNKLYTSTTVEARTQELPQPRQDRGISIQRRYQRLDDDNQPQDLSGLRVGDRVLVTLQLTFHNSARFVAVDDPLPSVLEAVNPEFRTQESRAAQPSAGESWWISDYREIRKDRCRWFADEIEPGVYTLSYVARVRAAGTATAPPAKVEQMYQPQCCGLTESQVLVSEPLK